MKIAIMMRAMDQDSGLRAYTGQLVENLLKIDNENYYLLFYRTEKWFGRYSKFDNVKEFLIKAPHKLIWDQIKVPIKAWKEKADIIYNPKFSVPLISHCPVTMGLQEPAWWVWPEHYEWLDRNYMKLMLPLYCRKSSHIFPISKFVFEETLRFFNIPEDKISIAYAGPNEHFKIINNYEKREDFRKKYNLPSKYILGVTRVDHPGLDKSTSFFPGKNVETTIKAYKICKDKIEHKLVVAGRNVKNYLLNTGWPAEDLQGIFFTDFVSHDDMPLLYNLADLFLMPSFYEGFGLALVEAISCGCPVIASSTGSLPEVGGDAVLYAEPTNPNEYAEKITKVLNNNNLQNELREQGIKRAAFFDWKRTAKAVLSGLTKRQLKTNNTNRHVEVQNKINTDINN